MKLITFLFLLLFAFSSCRKDFASFQKSPNLVYASKKNSVTPEVEVATNKPTLIASMDDSPTFIQKKESFSPKTIKIESKKILVDNDRRKQKKKSDVSHVTFLEKIFQNQTNKDNKNFKKRRNSASFNSTIYTGFIILGIAILLALLSLNPLSLLFGLASIIFLYVGFKRYFRKKRRRDIFR